MHCDKKTKLPRLCVRYLYFDVIVSLKKQQREQYHICFNTNKFPRCRQKQIKKMKMKSPLL